MGAEPPMLIGGSTTPVRGQSVVGFDAYCATVHANPDALLDDLTVLLDSAGFEPTVREGCKVRFYARSTELVDPKGKQLLLAKSGGQNPHPHIECLGPQSAVVAAYLRDQYSHQPSRIDHAIDLRAPGLFNRLHRSAARLCKKHGLRGSPAGDWVTPDGGRTFYVGSRTSQVYVRIYEKGIKYALDLGEGITPELRDWVRVELEFHPQTKVAKALAPSITGAQMWGSTQWTDELATEVLSVPSEPVTIRQRRESDYERALRFMGSQYSKHLRRLWIESGEDPCQFGQAVATLAGIDQAD